MKPDVLREWLLNWVPNMPTRALALLSRELRRGSGRVLRGAFEDDAGNGCLAEWAGRLHPDCRDMPFPGVEFLEHIGASVQSGVVAEWDQSEHFRQEILEALKGELRLRRRYGGRGSKLIRRGHDLQPARLAQGGGAW